MVQGVCGGNPGGEGAIVVAACSMLRAREAPCEEEGGPGWHL